MCECDICPSCGYCVTAAPHLDDCDRDAGGTAPTPGPTADDTPVCEGVHLPAEGAYLVIDGVVRQVSSSWLSLGPTYDGRIRWGVVTQSEADERRD